MQPSELFTSVTTTGPTHCWTADSTAEQACREAGELQQSVYQVTAGAIPNGSVVRQRETCSVETCLNPLHLRLRSPGSHVDSRERAGHTARGSKNGRARLTEDDVIAIRGSASSELELANTYRVSPRTIRGILRRETWRHV